MISQTPIEKDDKSAEIVAKLLSAEEKCIRWPAGQTVTPQKKPYSTTLLIVHGCTINE